MRIKNIFFDFDGVLADSVHVKTEAFYKLYLSYGEDIAEKVVSHHTANGGMSRYEKFKLYHQDFLSRRIDEKQVQKMAKEFSSLVVDGVIASSEVPGAKEFLKKHREDLNYWIITGTPTEEMLQIAEARGIRKYFRAICGSPTKKDEWVIYLLDKYELDARETLFLGDAKSDYQAAVQHNLHFALREHEDNKTLFSEFEGIRFKDFYELENEIEL